jgi:hypothetical protein
LSLDQGYETTISTPAANHGRLAWKTDGYLYARNAAGTETKLNPAASSEITDELTTITHSAPSTPDYAIQDLTTTTPYGFVTADEGQTVLAVIANLQARVNELEAVCVAAGILVDAD